MQNNELSESYNQVAEEYVARIFDELEHKPLDRQLLDRFAQEVQPSGSVYDMGCGPGHITRYLYQQGVAIQGLDLSAGMVEQARKLNPAIEFHQGSMAALTIPDETLGGIIAFYSLIHLPRKEVGAVLQEFRRVLKAEGLLLLSFHQGQKIVHLDEWWGKKVALDFTFFEKAEMESYLQSAGFVIEDCIERPPYEVEVQTQRVYFFARKSQ